MFELFAVKNRIRQGLVACIAIGCFLPIFTPAAFCQPAAGDKIRINLPENADVRLLVDLVSQRLGIKVLYDDAVANKRITVKAPEEIPVDSLLAVLESALKIKGLALVDADVPGWKRIVESKNLIKIARPGLNPPAENVGPTEAITQAFTLQHIDPSRLETIIKPFLTEPGANTLVLAEQQVLIVTDYAVNLKKIAELVEAVDQAGPEAILEFYQAQNVEAPSLQKQITAVLTARIGGGAAAAAAGPALQITPDERTNQLAIVGVAEQVEEAKRIAKALDVPLGQRTEVYRFRYVEATRIDRLIKDMFDELTIKRLYQSAIDEDDNLLIVTATKEIHDRIRWLAEQLDIEAQRPGSAVQFYKLKFADALEVIQTIQSIRQNGLQFDPYATRGVSPLGRGRWNNNQYSNPTGYYGRFVPGPNQPYVPGTVYPAPPPGYIPPPQPTTQIITSGVANSPADPNQTASQVAVTTPQENAGDLLSAAARVTADPTTNSIIVVADRAVQEVYKSLIEYLDKRRPQVMVEAKVVIVNTSHNYSLGVEVSLGDRNGIERLFEFTSFGLSTVDPITGSLALIPGRGFNWTLVDPDTADAVLRALSTHNRARVTSTPKVLVNDNATGTLASVAEVPFTSINASDTVATTSFAGFAEAGTTIEVTPRISDGDHLQLDYVVTLNSFTGTGGDGVPPPRQTDEVASSVTIPDGYTVIVGGLKQTNNSFMHEGVPFLEHIPVLRELTSIESKAASESTLFVFLKPVILRDDKFADLKYISDVDVKRACVTPNFPTSRPVLIRGAYAGQ